MLYRCPIVTFHSFPGAANTIFEMPSANIQNLQSIEVRYDVHGNKLLKRENGLKRYAKDMTTTRTRAVDKASYCVTGEKSKSEMDQEIKLNLNYYSAGPAVRGTLVS